MNFRRFLASAAGGLLAVVATAGAIASPTQAAARHTHDPLVFYEVTHGCASDPFWLAETNGANAAARLLHVKVIVSEAAPNQCGNIADQVSRLSAAIAAHPSGIAVTIPNGPAFSKDLRQAERLGIPLVAYNTIPHNVNRSVDPFEAYIGQPNYTAGIGAGQELYAVAHLKRGDTVLVVDQEPFNISLTSRFRGIEVALKPLGIKVVQLATNDNESQGAQLVKSYFVGHPNTVNAIQTLGPISTAQAADALRELGLLKKVTIGAFDLDNVTLHYIETGDVAFTVDQQPFLQGFDAVMELYQQAVYGAQPVDIITGPVFLTHQNVRKLAKFVNETGY